MKTARQLILIRSVTALALFGPLTWVAWNITPVPLLLLLGISSALVAIRAGQAGEARYGRRVPVTEMYSVGKAAGDPQMQVGGVAGYLMILFFGLAAWFGLFA